MAAYHTMHACPSFSYKTSLVILLLSSLQHKQSKQLNLTKTTAEPASQNQEQKPKLLVQLLRQQWRPAPGRQHSC
jgi:hypothetical protein